MATWDVGGLDELEKRVGGKKPSLLHIVKITSSVVCKNILPGNKSKYIEVYIYIFTIAVVDEEVLYYYYSKISEEYTTIFSRNSSLCDCVCMVCGWETSHEEPFCELIG